MGLGKLQVWITSEGDPCKISERDEHDNLPWVVAIMHCDGRVLDWCGRKYFGLEAKCGHLEVEIPPGCYIVRAADGQSLNPQGGVTGNHWSDHGVVTVCCDQVTCVTLFAPSAHHCGHGFLRVVERLVAADRIPREIGVRAQEALTEILKRLPQSNYDNAALPMLDNLLKHAEKPKGKGAPHDK